MADKTLTTNGKHMSEEIAQAIAFIVVVPIFAALPFAAIFYIHLVEKFYAWVNQ